MLFITFFFKNILLVYMLAFQFELLYSLCLTFNNVSKQVENKITLDKYHSVSNFVKRHIYFVYFSEFRRL